MAKKNFMFARRGARTHDPGIPLPMMLRVPCSTDGASRATCDPLSTLTSDGFVRKEIK